MTPKLLSLLLREHWAITPNYALAGQTYLESMLRGNKVDFKAFAGSETFMTSIISPDGRSFHLEDDDSDHDIAEDSVAVIGISGVMMKFGGLCSYGTEEISAMLSTALSIENISGAILRIHSPGGTVNSVIPMKNALAERSKPVVALVDSMAASAAYYVACMADMVIAVDSLAEVGSIGAMATILNDTKRREEKGEELIKIYAPQSSYKNKPVEDALEGNTDTYATEVLAPIAENFIQHVKTHRQGKLDEEKEGILAGKMFYAEDALKAGLIDDIGTMDKALELTRKLAIRKSIINLV